MKARHRDSRMNRAVSSLVVALLAVSFLLPVAPAPRVKAEMSNPSVNGVPDGVPGSSPVTLQQDADLAVSKSGLPSPVYSGETLTYTLVITNNGPAIATGVVLTDVLPAGVGFVSAEPSQGRCGHASGVVTCRLDANLLANPGAEGGDLSGWNILSNGGDGWFTTTWGYEGSHAFITSWDWDTRYQEVDLVAAGLDTAFLDTAPLVDAGEWFMGVGLNTADPYYLRVELRDQSHAAIASWDAGTQVSPLLASDAWLQQAHTFSGYGSGLRYIYFEDGGMDSEFRAGHYGTVLDAAFASVEAVDLGVYTVTLVVTVLPTVTGVVINTASVMADQNDPVPANNVTTYPHLVLPSSDLAVSKSGLPSPAYSGGTLTYTLVITNNGPSIASGVVLTDVLPAEVNFVSAEPSQGRCGHAGGVVTCRLDANLLANPGAESGDLSGWNILSNGGDGWTTITGGYVGSRAFITSWGWDTRYQEIDLVAAGLDPAFLDTAPPVDVGEWFIGGWPDYADHYYLHAELRDESHAAIASWDAGTQLSPLQAVSTWVRQAHTFSGYGSGLRYIYFEDGGVDVEFWAGHYGTVLDAAFVGVGSRPLDPGVYTVTLVVAVPSTVTGVFLNTASVTADQHDPVPSNNATGGYWHLFKPSSDLAVSKRGAPDPVLAGGTLTFTLVITNSGPSIASGVVLTDVLPAGVGFVSAEPSQGRCGYASGVVTCSLDVNLLANPGAESGDLSGWNILSNGGDGWAAITRGYVGSRDFITSWDWDTRYQEIDLVAAGLDPAFLDTAPPVDVGEWFVGCWPDYADYYYLHAELRDGSHAAIATWDAGTQLSPLQAVSTWVRQAHTFSGYGSGLRYIYFEDGGIDVEFWAGRYGAGLDAAFVGVGSRPLDLGVYTVTLVVTVPPTATDFVNTVSVTADQHDPDPSNSTDAYTVTVIQPIAGLRATNSSPTMLGQSSTLRASVSAGTHITYTWSLGDGQHAAGATVQHTYPEAGLYAAVVTASNMANLLTASTVVSVAVAIRVDPGQGGALFFSDTNGLTTSVTVPPGAVTQTVTLACIPLLTSTHPLSPGLRFANHAFILEVYLYYYIYLPLVSGDSSGGQEAEALPPAPRSRPAGPAETALPGFAFRVPITVTIHYSDTDVVGMNEETLRILYSAEGSWLESTDTCSPSSVYQRDLEQNVLSVAICHLTEFIMVGQ